MDELRLIDTFSGIGGFSYAAEKLVGGFKTVAFVECEPFCQKVLKKHWPHVEQFHDIRTYKPEPYSADVICGGFPCQDISLAGQGKGITKETRSGLFYELIRVIRLVRPKYIVLENVAAILNNGLGIVLGELAEAGFNCEWACIPASALGACHRRDRWWLVAYPQSNRDYRNATTMGQEIGQTSQQKFWPELECEITNIERNRRSTESSSKELFFAYSEGSERNGNETIEKHGKARTQEIFRDRNGGENTYTWRNTPHELKGDWREWSVKPVICRTPNGVPSGVDRAKRLKALGNSIVPQVAAIPLQRVLDLHNVTMCK